MICASRTQPFRFACVELVLVSRNCCRTDLQAEWSLLWKQTLVCILTKQRSGNGALRVRVCPVGHNLTVSWSLMTCLQGPQEQPCQRRPVQHAQNPRLVHRSCPAKQCLAWPNSCRTHCEIPGHGQIWMVGRSGASPKQRGDHWPCNWLCPAQLSQWGEASAVDRPGRKSRAGCLAGTGHQVSLTRRL